MSRSRVRPPSPALVISLVALFVSLGGVGYAAVTIGSKQIKNNSVASTDLKNNSVASTDIKNGTIVSKDINAKTRAALKGAKGSRGADGRNGTNGTNGTNGANGANGAPGSARAYGNVEAFDGGLVAGTTMGLGSATVTKGGTGKYCLNGLPFAPRNVMVTNTIVGGGGATAVAADIGSNPTLTGCPAGTQVSFVMRDKDGVAADAGFSFLLN